MVHLPCYALIKHIGTMPTSPYNYRSFLVLHIVHSAMIIIQVTQVRNNNAQKVIYMNTLDCNPHMQLRVHNHALELVQPLSN